MHCHNLQERVLYEVLEGPGGGLARGFCIVGGGAGERLEIDQSGVDGVLDPWVRGIRLVKVVLRVFMTVPVFPALWK